MSEDTLRAAMSVFRPRTPETPDDVEALRAEVRLIDRELGALIRARRDATSAPATDAEEAAHG